jgi:hypothetical protein
MDVTRKKAAIVRVTRISLRTGRHGRSQVWLPFTNDTVLDFVSNKIA